MKARKAAKLKESLSVAGISARAPDKDGLSYRVRLAVVRDPTVDFPAVAKRLKLKGADAKPASHAGNVFHHARAVAWLCLDQGWAPK